MADAPSSLTCPGTADPFTVVACRVDRPAKGEAYHWAVTGPGRVSRATTARDRCEWTAPPGLYRVTLLIITVADGEPAVREATAAVVIAPPPAPPPPPPPPAPPADPVARARSAMHRIQCGSAGCTATVIGDRQGRGYLLLTAAHCVPAVGSRGDVWHAGGERVAWECIARDPVADLAWVVTEATVLTFPSAVLATAPPKPGDKVLHAGFGIDRPGDVQQGEVVAPENKDHQVQFRLSVSSGDSGGGICLTASGEVLAAVCCTTRPGGVGDVWGGSAQRAWDILPLSRRVGMAGGWTPLPIPQRMPPGK